MKDLTRSLRRLIEKEIDGERKRIHAVNMKPGVRRVQREHPRDRRRGPVDEK
jgi:hypothetical protein